MLINPENVPYQVVSRAMLKRTHRIGLLAELRRMNIHEASLFPGLDGFARSLGTILEISLDEQIEIIKKETAELHKKYRDRIEQDHLGP